MCPAGLSVWRCQGKPDVLRKPGGVYCLGRPAGHMQNHCALNLSITWSSMKGTQRAGGGPLEGALGWDHGICLVLVPLSPGPILLPAWCVRCVLVDEMLCIFCVLIPCEDGQGSHPCPPLTRRPAGPATAVPSVLHSSLAGK